MKYFVVVFLVSVLCVSGVIAQGVVQISTERDAEGKFSAWTPLAVTWGADVVSTISDHRGVDNDSLQEWYTPVVGGWLLFSFIRTDAGEYAIRWSFEGSDSIWSQPSVVTIVPPGRAVHN